MELENGPQVVVVTEGGPGVTKEIQNQVQERLKNFTLVKYRIIQSLNEFAVIQNPKGVGAEIARELWELIKKSVMEWMNLIQKNQVYLLNIVREIHAKLQKMKDFYKVRTLKKDIDTINKSNGELKTNVALLSTRIKSLAEFISKIHETFNEKVKKK